MSLQSAIEAELPFLRAEAEARMVARVTVYRKSGRQVQDESTGEESPEWLPIHLDLPARFPPDRDGGKSRQVSVGGVDVVVGLREFHVPYFTDDLAEGDFVEVISGRSSGSVWRIVEASPPGDQATAYRLDIVQESRPDEWGF